MPPEGILAARTGAEASHHAPTTAATAAATSTAAAASTASTAAATVAAIAGHGIRTGQRHTRLCRREGAGRGMARQNCINSGGKPNFPVLTRGDVHAGVRESLLAPLITRLNHHQGGPVHGAALALTGL